mmetsp:Transcript_3064/g.5910  ORF Transcript_3064/g.5910 Transcript_3064/m.5910 type:complete len:295 (+) Transcript_3064:1795-2679(+)
MALSVISRLAMHSTRRPWLMRSCNFCSTFATEAESAFTVQNFRTRSGAPLRIAKNLPDFGFPWTVSIHLFSELKGISNTFSCSGFSLVAFAAAAPPLTSEDARRMATSVGDPIHRSTPLSILRSAALFRIPHNAMLASSCFFAKTSVSLSRLFTSRLLTTDTEPSGTTRSCTVISPVVSVPVLSEQNTDTQPSVSMASILRTITFRAAIWSEAIMSEIVTVGSKPSGTWAKSAAAAFCRTSAAVRFTGDTTLATRLRRPTQIATMAMMWTKCSIWISSVDFTLGKLRLALILPR